MPLIDEKRFRRWLSKAIKTTNSLRLGQLKTGNQKAYDKSEARLEAFKMVRKAHSNYEFTAPVDMSIWDEEQKARRKQRRNGEASNRKFS